MNTLVNVGKITGVVLAGGRGQRFGGQDKGLILFQKKPLIEQVLARFVPQVDEIIINANRNLEHYQCYGHRLISDVMPDYPGPLAGIFSAMQQMTHDWLLSAPCDTPFLPEQLAQRFRQAHQHQPHGAYVATIGEKMQPVFTLLHRCLQPKIQAYLSQSQRKVGLFLQQQQAISVDFSDVSSGFSNINCPQDCRQTIAD
jgi:molybdopterin-guanine dinucleotide biosynthesis protein A